VAKKSAKSSSAGTSVKPTLIEIESVAQYIETVQEIAAEEDQAVWLRGVSKASHRLLPSVLRNTVPHMSARGELLRGNEIVTAGGSIDTGISPERMLDDFKRRAVPFLDSIPRNDFEWLFLMQHHGVPTRLLDWTTNALVALFFAVDGVKLDPDADRDVAATLEPGELNEFDAHASAIYLINPCKVNGELQVDIAEPIDIAANYKHWKSFARPMDGSSGLDVYAPICIVAPQISPRIRAQSGLFTLHGSNLEPIDHYVVVRPLITKFLIPHPTAVRIRSDLHLLGITPSFIYPGLDGVAKDVTESAQRNFDSDRRKHSTKHVRRK